MTFILKDRWLWRFVQLGGYSLDDGGPLFAIVKGPSLMAKRADAVLFCCCPIGFCEDSRVCLCPLVVCKAFLYQPAQHDVSIGDVLNHGYAAPSQAY